MSEGHEGQVSSCALTHHWEFFWPLAATVGNHPWINRFIIGCFFCSRHTTCKTETWYGTEWKPLFSFDLLEQWYLATVKEKRSRKIYCRLNRYLCHYFKFLYLKKKNKINTKPTQIRDPDFLNLLRNNFPDHEFCLPILFLFCVNPVLVIDQHQLSLISEGTESRTLIVSLVSITVFSHASFFFGLKKKNHTINDMPTWDSLYYPTFGISMKLWNHSLQQYLIDGLWR